MPSKLTVTNEKVGTFTRRTNRTYTHLVVSCGESESLIRQRFADRLNNAKRQFEQYTEAAGLAVTTGKKVRRSRNEDRLEVATPTTQNEIGFWDAAQWQEWADSNKATMDENAAKLEGALASNRAIIGAGRYSLQGWCGRLDLAQKLASTAAKNGAQNVHIIEVATGKLVA